jgi:hypothetical protein
MIKSRFCKRCGELFKFEPEGSLPVKKPMYCSKCNKWGIHNQGYSYKD